MRCSFLGYADLKLPAGNRSSGVHLSGVIRAMMADMGRKWASEEEPGHDGLCRMALGLAWEEWYGPLAFGGDYHPGEFEFDGILFTPDAVDWERRIVYEIKTTSKRSTSPEASLHWLLQVKGELWAIGRGEWRRAGFHVLQLSPPQRIDIWGLEFDPDDLDRTWRMILSYKDKAKPEVW